MADTKLTGLSELSVPALTDVTYVVDAAGAVASLKVTAARFFGLGPHLVQGRLTLTTAVPVTTAGVTGAGTLYFTPYNGNRVRLWDGTRWLMKSFSEISLALTLTSGKNYDVFLDDDAATLVLSAAWTNDTTRADAVALQDGVTVLGSDHTKLHVGTIRASGTNTTEDSAAKRYLWNRYNQADRYMKGATETTDSWTYTTATYRQANANAANQLDYVTGDAATLVSADVYSLVSNSLAINVGAGVGVDSTTTNSGISSGENCYSGAGGIVPACAHYHGYPGLGRHYLAWLEYSEATGTTSWYGDVVPGVFQAAIYGEIRN